MGPGGHYSRGPQAGGMAVFSLAGRPDGVLTLGLPVPYFPAPLSVPRCARRPALRTRNRRVET